jgi:hypothetical protein
VSGKIKNGVKDRAKVTSNGGATPEVNSRMKAEKIKNRRNRLVEDSSLGAKFGSCSFIRTRALHEALRRTEAGDTVFPLL